MIAILAAISIIAYNGIQNRGFDVSVQTDLKQVGQQIESAKIINDVLPTANSSGLTPLGIRVSKSAYNCGFLSGGCNNFVYCRLDTGQQFALVAYSKSGNGFKYQDGSVTSYASAPASFSTICPSTGMNPTGGRIWFMAETVAPENGWHTFVAG